MASMVGSFVVMTVPFFNDSVTSDIQVVRLEDPHHLTRVEDCNRILPGDVMVIRWLLGQWRIG
jgi:hypothetical protein